MQYKPLFDEAYLYSVWADEFEEFLVSDDAEVLRILKNWSEGARHKETSAQGAFVDIFFKRLWGYIGAGEADVSHGYTCQPEFNVPNAGQGGRTGFADLALGYFGDDNEKPIPQVLCEFKGIGAGLDIPQNRKGNDRSPMEQCGDYRLYTERDINRAYRGRPPVRPAWGLVTNMNEFRLFHAESGLDIYQKFVIIPETSKQLSLTSSGRSAAFQRFLFKKIFSSTCLLSDFGPSELERLLDGQGEHEKNIESAFYKEYHGYRITVYEALVAANPDFPGTRGKLVRLTQRFLDRCIFTLYCEDMGRALDYPPNLLREVLEEISASQYINRNDNAAWDIVKRLFKAMRDGGVFGNHTIPRFNGGLFELDPELEYLNIPTYIFCEPGQRSQLAAFPNTLLYLSARYNFGVNGGEGENAINLYTLGRIFEQSITELEIMEAEADGRASLNKVSKRKRDGVYYTPERIVRYIIRQTVGERIKELKENTGVTAIGAVTDEQITEYHLNKDRRLAEHRRIKNYTEALERFRKELEQITILDPACGSGAFLIGALDELVQAHQWVINELSRVTAQTEYFDQDAITKDVLSKNIYGVDINSESVEIAKLALWLETAVPGKPLCRLDHTIRCGNSLIGLDYYSHVQGDLLTDEHREKINVFDWQQAFPEVFERGGFDVVIGNPPYVKLQNFKKIYESMATYLVEARSSDGLAKYKSTQTGNFDLYLPFIERGVQLLRSGGYLGYIAPSVWLKNDYGEGLRRWVHDNRSLERWVDFKSFQIFEEATTYTALQFFKKNTNSGIAYAAVPDGNPESLDWSIEEVIAYSDIPPNDTWNLQPRLEYELMQKLSKSFPNLATTTQRIFQGLITSADDIYHLHRVGPNTYLPKKADTTVTIEDGIMRPLVSGPEAKRYQKAITDIYILFPYRASSDGDIQLLSQTEMIELFPRAWGYLRSHEERLRSRESSKFDDDKWYRFGRNQNLDKQDLPKLIVAQTVPNMRVCYDAAGEHCLNNVRVNGILADDTEAARYLLGVLNSTLIDFLFRRIAAPKDNGYFEANKQYIAPLPIADAKAEQRKHIVELATLLESSHTKRRDLILSVEKRLNSNHMTSDKRKLSWLWGLKSEWKAWKNEAPNNLKGKEITEWCKSQCEEFLSKRYLPIDQVLVPGADCTVDLDDGELVISIKSTELERTTILDGIFAEDEAPWIAAQWRHHIRTTNITDKYDGRRLVRDLLKLKKTDNAALRNRVIEIDEELSRLENEILQIEDEVNELIFDIYGLNADERAMVRADTRPIW